MYTDVNYSWIIYTFRSVTGRTSRAYDNRPCDSTPIPESMTRGSSSPQADPRILSQRPFLATIYPVAAVCATRGRNCRSIGNSINAGPSIFSASSKRLRSSIVFSARKAGHPYDCAIALAFKPGKSNAGTFGVCSRTANSFSIAYSSLTGTKYTILTLC